MQRFYLWLLVLLMAACGTSKPPQPDSNPPSSQARVPTYEIALSQSSFVLSPGSVNQTTLTITAFNQLRGISGKFDLSLVGAPAGVSVSPLQVNIPSKVPSAQFTLTLAQPANLPPASASFTLAVRSGSQVQSLPINLVLPPPPGSLDSTFGTGGKVINPNGNSLGVMVQQGDGKLVVASSGAILVRYNLDGTPDTAFNQSTPDSRAVPSDILIDGNGKFVVALNKVVKPCNYCEPIDLPSIVRYHADGSFDTTLAADELIVGQNSTRVLSIALQPDGKIVAVGFTSVNNAYNAPRVWRINPTGGLDSTFANNGTLDQTIAGMAYASSVVLQNGKIVIGGGTGFSIFMLCRLNADGSYDYSFGYEACIGYVFGGTDVLHSLAQLPDGKLIASGISNTSSNYTGTARFVLIRTDANGYLDTTFGNAGKVVTDISPLKLDYGFSDMVLQGDKPVLLGTAGTPTQTDLVLARYNSNGSLDSTFGQAGLVLLDLGADYDHARDLLLQSDGKLVVGGENSIARQILVRYNP